MNKASSIQEYSQRQLRVGELIKQKLGEKMKHFVNKELSIKNSASNFIKAVNGEFNKLFFKLFI